jgi:4-amino-4-deoxy-L-arabinose transferase-like glycosyltransferase
VNGAPTLPAPAGPTSHTRPPALAIEESSHPERRSVRTEAALFLLLLAGTTLVCFYDLSGGAGFDPPDAWVAQTAREMSESADWRGYVVPRFSGETRLQKSPGPYWAVLLAGRGLGRPVDEFTARLPTAGLAVGLVAVIYWLARQVAGARAALFAGFASASSLMLLYWSHRAAADLGVTTFVTLSLAALWIGSERHPPGRTRVALWMLGYFAAGLAMLYKMPMPLVCVGLPAALYVLVCRRWSILASPWHLPGVALFLLPWLPWVIAALLAEPVAWDKWRVEFLDRFTGDSPNVEGQQRDWKLYALYVGVVAVFVLPYTLSLPGAIWRAIRGEPLGQPPRQSPAAPATRDPVAARGRWFMLIWLASLLAFFTAAAGKETRYIVPALPPMFVLLGIELSRFFDPGRRARAALERAGAAVVTVMAPLGALLAMWLLHGVSQRAAEFGVYRWEQVRPAVLVTAAIIVSGVVLTAWLRAARREHAAFATLVGAMWCTWLWAWPNLMPIFSGQEAFRDFAQQLRALPPELRPALRQVAQQDPRITWYSDVRFPRVVDQLDLLREQEGRRNLQHEIEIVGRQIVAGLAADELALFVAAPGDFALFQALAPSRLAAADQPPPPLHVWMVARVGRPDQRYILFGNRPPPWPEPALHPLVLESVARLRQKAESALTPPITGRGQT